MTLPLHSKKTEQLLLKTIYLKYVEEHCDNPSRLEYFTINSLEIWPYKNNPLSVLKPIQPDFRPTPDYRYYKSLEYNGYIADQSNSSLIVSRLTEKGFCEGRRLKRPLWFFFKKHWRYIIPIIISTVLAIVAILRLTRCS